MARMVMAPAAEGEVQRMMKSIIAIVACALPEAAEAFGRVVRDFPAHAMADDAAALQAEALYQAGKLEEVDRACAVLAERWPDSPYRERAEFFRGLALAARGEDAKAAAAFEP